MEPRSAINFFRMGDRWQRVRCKNFKKIKRFLCYRGTTLQNCNSLAAKTFKNFLKFYFNMECAKKFCNSFGG